MAFLYNKSRSEAFRNYFSQDIIFTKKFNKYQMEKEEIVQASKEFVFSKENQGGIPLSWDAGEDTIMIDQTDSHTLVIGPTGSKKTRLIAMPTVRILGSAGESMVISDPKAEIYLRTASYLKKHGYTITVINLRNPSYSNRWNPLSIPYHFYCQGDIDKACEFANDIAKNLFSEITGKEAFWENSAASFLFGLIILLFKYSKENSKDKSYVNFSSIFELRSVLFEGNSKQSLLWRYAQEDPIIRNSLIGTVETANETRAGILSTFDQVMRDFSIQPNLLNMLGYNDLDLTDFYTKKQALYMIMPDEKTNYHKLVSVFVKQSYEYFIYLAQKNMFAENASAGFLPIRINYILDEFSSLPTVSDFPSMITAARSRNIRFFLFIQSKHQLKQRYEDETETIMANCINWVFLTTREISLLEDISKLCGMKEQKPVLSVAHLQRLDKKEGEVLLLIDRYKPYIAKLPDISNYDNDRVNRLPLRKHKQMSAQSLTFHEFKVSSHIHRTDLHEKIYPNSPSSPFTIEEIDNMIKEIDIKLQALDEEERREKDTLNVKENDMASKEENEK